MSVDEYKAEVIELFKSGKASDAQYLEMATSVLYNSENFGEVPEIDKALGVD